MRAALGRLALLSACVAGLLLAGCAGTPGADSSATSAAANPVDNKRRAEIRLQLAVGYYSQRQLPVALNEINQALSADPEFADAYSVRGLIYMDMGETRLAEENFKQALRLMPSNPEINNNYGWFLCQNGNPKESITYFETALKSRSYQSPAKAMSNAGVCSLKLGDKVAAERYLTQAFQADPANPQTNLQLAKIYYEQRNYERARFYAGRLVKAEFFSPELLWLAVRIEHKLGDRAAENGLANQLRRRYPDSSEYEAYQRGAFDE